MFFGRDEDIDRLTTAITVEKTTVLYGRSGLGKSSLLNAGVLPKLENEHKYFIIPVRFGSVARESLKHPTDVAEEQIAAAAKHDSFLNKIESEDISLWQHIKNLEFAHTNQTILLVFDQFEELFTYPEGVTEFALALADLVYSRIPKNFQRSLRLATRNKPDLLTPEETEFLERPVAIKVLMSIRSDRMSLLDRLSSNIPSILLNCYELKPLSTEQAEECITEPAQKVGEFVSHPFSYQPESLKKILDFLTQNGTKSIESFQLQILCQFVEETLVIAGNDTIVEANDLGDLEAIYKNYYDNSLEKLGNADEQIKARIFIEEGLIFAEEKRRTSLFEGQIQQKFEIGPELLRRLVDTHLIRSEPHSSGGYVYELSHDTLVAPILKAKSVRLENEKLQQLQEHLREVRNKRRKKLKRALWIFGLPIFMVFLFNALTIIDNLVIDIPLIGITLSIVFLLLLCLLLIIWLILPFAFVYEFIFGESLLGRLRKRVDDPEKQKGILTRIGRWLS